MRAPAAATRSRETPATRDLILDAAERRFAERGFAGVSMREIAAETGLKNQASLYHHFRDKQALYEAVLTRGVDALQALFTEPAGDPAALDAHLDRLVDYLVEHPHLPRLIQRAGIDDSRHLRIAVRQLLRPLYSQGLSLLGDAGGPWEPADLPYLAAGFYHLIFGYFADAALFAAVLDEDLHSPAAVARQRRFVKTAAAQLLGGAHSASRRA